MCCTGGEDTQDSSAYGIRRLLGKSSTGRATRAQLAHARVRPVPCAPCSPSAGAAQNLLSMSIAQNLLAPMGIVIHDVWITWALGALVPGLLSILTVPLLVARFSPPGL